MYYVFLFYVFSAIYLISFFLYLFINKSFLKLIILNGSIGIATLTIFKILEGYIQLAVNINLVSVILSSLCGVPGIGLYLVISNIFT